MNPSSISTSFTDPWKSALQATKTRHAPPQATSEPTESEVAITSVGQRALAQTISGAILPLDLLCEVLSHLTFDDAWLVAQVCRWWQELLAKDNRLRSQILRNHRSQIEKLKNVFPETPYNNRQKISLAAFAAAKGYIAVLKWMNQLGLQKRNSQINDYMFDVRIFNSSQVSIAAAFGGHLPVLQWVHANGFPWDESTCVAAATSGHLAVLQWAHDNGCHWEGKEKQWGWKLKNELKADLKESLTVIYILEGSFEKEPKEFFGAHVNNLPSDLTNQASLEKELQKGFQVKFPNAQVKMKVLDKTYESELFEYVVNVEGQDKAQGWIRIFSSPKKTVMLTYQTETMDDINKARAIWVETLKNAKAH